MKLAKLIYILLSLLLLTTTYAQDNNSNEKLVNFQQIGNAEQQVQVFTALLDLEDIDSDRNREIVRQFREQTEITGDIPIVTERLTESQAVRLGIKRLSDENIQDFIEEYRFTNPIIDEPISDEAVKYLETGEAPEDLKDLIKDEIMRENWENSRNAKISKSVNTPSRVYSQMSKATLKLTVIRMAFNGVANIVSVFAKSGHVAKSLFMGAVSSAMTGMVQASPEFFEKLMAGNLARLKFFGLESVFIFVPMFLSHVLEIKPISYGTLAFDIFVYGIITVFSQGNAEIWAAKQTKRMREFLEKQIIKVENSTTLTREAKDLLLSRLMGLHAEIKLSFSRVMVGGSLIWAQAVALAAAGMGDVAIYSVFASLWVYSITIKYVTAKGMLAFDKKAFKNGFKALLKDLRTIHIGGPKVLKEFGLDVVRDTKEVARILSKAPKLLFKVTKGACNRLFRSKQALN